MAMQEEHIIDIALNGKYYCSSKWQCYFVVGASVRMHGARMFTPQMIAGSTWKEGTNHFFKIKETALSLMVPNVGLKWKQKKNTVNTFKVLTTRLHLMARITVWPSIGDSTILLWEQAIS
jgi:hypothetical protein